MTGSGNWTYFFAGRSPALIDAGVGEPSHLQRLADVSSVGPRHVCVTHAHTDHIAGVRAILERWPNTMLSKLPWPGRDANFAAQWRPLNDGDTVDAGDDVLEVVHTPGHAPDHVSFWLERERALFSGDLIVAGTTVVIPASMGGSLSAYLQSLERVRALQPARLYPAHGAPIDNADAIIDRYIAHRHEREAQVIAGLRAGLHTIDALVSRIYLGLNPALVPMARESVLAHLRKLEHDGAARQEGDEWAWSG